MEEKNPVVILSLGFLVAVMLLVMFFCIFVASTSNEDSFQILAAFGSYMGGVLTPITVLAALIAIIQREKTHNNEMKSLAAQGNKVDILRFIEKIEEDIESALNQLSITIEVSGHSVQHPASDALFKISLQEWEQIIPVESEALKLSNFPREGIPRYDEKFLSFEIFTMVAAYIKRLRYHCKEYDKVAKNNVTSVYFASKYRLATERLNTKGYSINIWEISAQQGVAPDRA